MRDVGGAQRRGQAEVSAGECFADAHDVGADASVVGGEQLAGPAESGGDLIEHEQHVVPPADLPQVGQIARIVEAHPACALYHRLDDDGRQFVGVIGQLRLERRHVGGVVVARNLRREHLPGQDIRPQREHAAVRIADAHRGERVAVIAAAPGHQPVLSGRPRLRQY